ncbi:MAG TPA: peptidylprolyl isomerase [Paenirhodobacter sp.]
MFRRDLLRVAALGVALSASTFGAAQAAENPDLVLQIGGTHPGKVVIQLFADTAPEHAKRIAQLANDHAYDGVVFHRVIDGFMAQTGDVQFGKRDGDTSMAGMGGSTYPDLKAEFSDKPFGRGTVGMARSSSPDSANSQFFIMFAPAPHLNGQYTAIGQVTEGMDVVDAIKKGDSGRNGLVAEPDYILSATIE